MFPCYARTVPAMQDRDARRRRLAKIGAAAGALLALVCHCVPPKYQAACTAISQVATLTCGAPGPGGH